MNDKLKKLVNEIPNDDTVTFTKNTDSVLSAKKVIDKVSVDYSWVDVLNESIPYLDTIIRNPRRFISTEEEIVPIEKTKKVAEESIKHLAVHTNLIQDVDEDGVVKPLKLLNIFKEETIDLYENRFIYSLITNLSVFVREQLTYQEESASNKEEEEATFEATTNFDGRTVKYKMNLVCAKDDPETVSEAALADRQAKIQNISDVLEDFRSTKFMKSMSNATPVRSPIRKTNVILKEQNFIKALELWEFLESYQIQKPVKEEHLEEDISTNLMKKDFDLTYFINYCILNKITSSDGDADISVSGDISKALYDFAKKFDVDDKELRRKINEELTNAENYKNSQKEDAKKCYNLFIDNHNLRFNKANLLFK